MNLEEMDSEDVSFINGRFQKLYEGFQEQITFIQEQSYLDNEFREDVGNMSGVLSAISNIELENVSLESQSELSSLEDDIRYMTVLNTNYVNSVKRVVSEIERQLSDVDTRVIDNPQELYELVSRGNLVYRTEILTPSDEDKLLSQMLKVWIGFDKVRKSYEDVCGGVDIETLYRISNKNEEFINPILGKLNDYMKKDKKYVSCAEGLKTSATGSVRTTYGISALKSTA